MPIHFFYKYKHILIILSYLAFYLKFKQILSKQLVNYRTINHRVIATAVQTKIVSQYQFKLYHDSYRSFLHKDYIISIAHSNFIKRSKSVAQNVMIPFFFSMKSCMVCRNVCIFRYYHTFPCIMHNHLSSKHTLIQLNWNNNCMTNILSCC